MRGCVAVGKGPTAVFLRRYPLFTVWLSRPLVLPPRLLSLSSADSVSRVIATADAAV